MIFIIALIGAIGFTIIIVQLLGWHEEKVTSNKISFNSFKKFYELNPKRWIVHYGSVTCKTAKNACDNDDVFCFKFIDYYKYRSWLKQQENIKRQNIDIEATKRMMEAVKEDIAKSEAEAKKMFERYSDIDSFQKLLEHWREMGLYE